MALLCGHAHRLDGALVEPEGDAGVADLVPDRVEVLLGPLDLRRIQRPVADGTQYCGRALEDGEVRGDLGRGHDELEPVEPVPITPTRWPVMSTSSGQAPVCTSLPSKESMPGNVGDVGGGEQSQRVDQVASRCTLRRCRCGRPSVAGLVEARGRDLGVQLDVAAQVVAVHDVLQVAEDVLGWVEVTGGPVPVLEQFVVEGVAVDEALGVGQGARVPVPVPGAADAAGLVEARGR